MRTRRIFDGRHSWHWLGVPVIVMGVAFGPSGGALAQSGVASGKLEYQLILPSEKVPLKVAEGEENPFVAPAMDEASKDLVNSEENKVKERLMALRVAGASPRGESYQVLLGDMILESGMLVPPFFHDQIVRLRVKDITRDAIEFVWLEKERTGLPPRTLLLPINIRPDVRYVLPGQQLDGKEKEIQLGIRPVQPMAAAGDELRGTAEVKRAVEVEMDETVKETGAETASEVRKTSGLLDSVVDSFFGRSAANRE
jgi:hypothetical protein